MGLLRRKKLSFQWNVVEREKMEVSSCQGDDQILDRGLTK